MNRRNIYTCYLTAIAVCLLIIVGLIQMMDKKEEGRQKDTKPGTHGQEQVPESPEDGGADKGTASLTGAMIRVLLLSTGFQDTVHPEVQVSSECGLKITAGDAQEVWQSQEVLVIRPDDARFQKGNIRIQPLEEGKEILVSNISRGYGTPSYAGVIELRTTAEGIAMINELLLEQYLCKVVPSEMPASYELEALKAQAVCARSYAARQIGDYAYPEYEAHVNDSTDYQVYNNSQIQERSSQAVYDTEGQVVKYHDTVATTYYYSTSCGKTTSMEAWGTAPNEGNGYLQSIGVCGDDGDYEKDLPWYRWTANVSVQTLSDLVGLNTGTDVGTIQNVEVTKRGPGDIAEQIKVTGDKGEVTVDTENKIRTALGGSGYTITKNDGTVVDSMKLLPSAFFSIERSGDQFVISGGGFGHGIGMSQNGANEMAKQGKGYREILTLFYQGVTIE